MPPVPPVEPAPLTPPTDADAGIPSAPPSRRGRRRADARKFRPGRITLVLATAALSVGALVAVHNAEGGGHPNAATNPSTTASPSPKGSSASRHQVQSRSDPSGVAMPMGNLPGWQLTYSQDFHGTTLPSGWGAYRGDPGGDSYGYWDPANVTVSNGELHLRTTANDDPQRSNTASTGGVSFYGNPQTYGMYLVRMKADYEPALQISNIALLWPADGNTWPPEMDFYEDEGGSRGGFTASLHPGPDGDDCCVIRHTLSIAATQWHTYGIIWTPTSITYTIDGRPWGVVQKSQVSAPGEWPSIPMNLDLQSQNLGPAQPDGSIETMTVAWVAEYAPSS